MTSRGNVAWHGLHAGEAVRLLGTDLENGLTESEATARLARFGPNKVTRRRRSPRMEALPASVPRAPRLHPGGRRRNNSLARRVD
jgi:cation transport ATPase-like protein